ncbi:hypothetical protein IC575_023056 [Cucumis melo]|uniref:Protein IQ-DOMAIN 2 n=1 Tax=Cucumis melo TaxID=3656 RepID=A0A1S3BG62_CUCME|nr:protein IQ-DOMAIN 2 [Cucumis melo]XP_008446905.2 protein IQ-DOMAIN 2 [Cucumis melo]XP_008446907.2 protein IQ-DOMAIN 2 [Cucumis melo]XP_008446908.2 protein IQ-DOMAIN 2 [Cucumis melo]XP_050946944.1 protein IQ-DOMAIN 2 [Cucumis melo]XP_050946945.1 protein IQ-DOMAIN 2 [Cucumis melo]
MGKKGSWFSAVKKVLTQPSEKNNKKPDRPKKKWFQKEESVEDVISFLEQTSLDVPAQPPIEDDVKQIELENEPSELVHPEAAEPVVAEAPPDVAVEYPPSPSPVPCRPEMSEEAAAIMIQTAFRGYTARRALRALKSLMRLKTLVQGQSVKRQVASTLKCMQTLTHLQSEIRVRRIRMSEENQALLRQLRNKREKDLEKLKFTMDGNWNHSTQSKAQIEAKLLNKHEAAIRRERALAYAYSHQQTWRNSSKTATPTVMDPNNPHWGWSWLERWMAARPWESRSTTDQLDDISVTSVATRASVVDVLQIYGRRDQNPTKLSPRTSTNQKSSQLHKHHSPSIPKALSSSSSRKKTNAAKSSISSWGGDDDIRSTTSVKSKLSRRHTISGSSFRDDESLASLPSVSSKVTPSKAVKTRSPSTSSRTEKGTLENGYVSAGSAKKRLSFSSIPVKPRRQSSPPIVNTS